ncbi:hypothetical protein DV096_12840 [Bradymonadaceae bacterium TMQ3]|nr:hypothetical protein DV096_12840 [Bradymonadaceae bacterium TMQ3]TXC74953.1 AAA family ATPase [Bradymonadales bacterium TMQ1]
MHRVKCPRPGPLHAHRPRRHPPSRRITPPGQARHLGGPLTLTQIEFIGLPGVGKSTCVERVINGLQHRGVDCLDRQTYRRLTSRRHQERSRPQRGFDYLFFLSKHPAVFRHGTSLSQKLGAPHPRALKRLYHLTRKLQNASLINATLDERLVVFDQNIVQEIWGLIDLRALPESTWLDPLVEACRPWLPDLVVALRLEPALALERLHERANAGGAFIEFGLPATLSAEDYARGHRIFDSLLASLRRVGVHCIDIDASPAPDSLARQTIDTLFEHLPSPTFS